MKSYLLSLVVSACLLSISTNAISSNAQNAANIIKDKAISYAIQSQKDAQFDMQAASRELSQNAMELGKIYGSSHHLKLNDVTSGECLEELANLGIDSQTFLNKALAGQYKTIAVVNGNIVMLIAGGAGQLTYTIIDKGGFCTIDKSIHDAYWSAKIIRLGLDGVNIAFS